MDLTLINLTGGNKSSITTPLHVNCTQKPKRLRCFPVVPSGCWVPSEQGSIVHFWTPAWFVSCFVLANSFTQYHHRKLTQPGKYMDFDTFTNIDDHMSLICCLHLFCFILVFFYPFPPRVFSDCGGSSE